ncbi:zinc finger protein 135-like isoform X2 [Ambystoma mexicanum]|uniref:zinc finger protein 135-like isoform X2 n=1 Tax=Ambystoma mexicanum TaxID=8296 RepID=UPI0037E8692C
MKTRKEMSHKDLDGAPLTFHDVVACFSEEEWKLLQHWQQELYNNLMKEIQQVFHSLGPLIATSVFSLQHKEMEDLCSDELQDFETHSNTSSSLRHMAAESGVSLMGNQHLKNTEDRKSCHGSRKGDHTQSSGCVLRKEEEPLLDTVDCYGVEGVKSSTDSGSGDHIYYPGNDLRLQEELESEVMDSSTVERAEGSTGHFSGDHIYYPGNDLRLQEELECELMDHSTVERGEGSTGHCSGHADITPVVSINIKREGESYSTDHIKQEKRESLPSTTRLEVATPVAAIGINEDGETYAIDIQDCKKRENVTGHEGNKSMKRGKDIGNSLQCNDKATQCKPTANKLKLSMVQRLHEKKRCVSISGSDQELIEEKGAQWNSTCNQPTLFKIHRITPHVGTSEKYNTIDRATTNDTMNLCDSNQLQSCKTYTYAESWKTYQKISPTQLERQHKVKGAFSCAECGKNFTAAPSLVRHERIHTGERPFHCAFCGKSFNRKEVLLRHQKMHTGEKPYQCNICGKGFNRKDHYLGHQKIHAQVHQSWQNDLF